MCVESSFNSKFGTFSFELFVAKTLCIAKAAIQKPVRTCNGDFFKKHFQFQSISTSVNTRLYGLCQLDY